MKIGVLAFQGAIEEHVQMLKSCGVSYIKITSGDKLREIDALILPGGESSTIGHFLEQKQLIEPIRDFAARGNPIMGTCAGMILLANKIENQQKTYLELMDISVKRNAFGRQRESFEALLDISPLRENKLKGIFIRAPYITNLGEGVKELARYDGKVVAARQDNLLVGAFHPELGQDIRWHKYFINMIKEFKDNG